MLGLLECFLPLRFLIDGLLQTRSVLSGLFDLFFGHVQLQELLFFLGRIDHLEGSGSFRSPQVSRNVVQQPVGVKDSGFRNSVLTQIFCWRVIVLVEDRVVAV